jgi:hypothetical protein
MMKIHFSDRRTCFIASAEHVGLLDASTNTRSSSLYSFGFETRSTCTWHSLTSIKAAHGANIYFSSRTGMCHAHTLLDISNNHNGPANAALAHTHGRAPALARLKHAFVQYVTAAAEGVEISVPLPFVKLSLSLTPDSRRIDLEIGLMGLVAERVPGRSAVLLLIRR